MFHYKYYFNFMDNNFFKITPTINQEKKTTQETIEKNITEFFSAHDRSSHTEVHFESKSLPLHFLEEVNTTGLRNFFSDDNKGAYTFLQGFDVKGKSEDEIKDLVNTRCMSIFDVEKINYDKIDFLIDNIDIDIPSPPKDKNLYHYAEQSTSLLDKIKGDEAFIAIERSFVDDDRLTHTRVNIFNTPDVQKYFKDKIDQNKKKWQDAGLKNLYETLLSFGETELELSKIIFSDEVINPHNLEQLSELALSQEENAQREYYVTYKLLQAGERDVFENLININNEPPLPTDEDFYPVSLKYMLEKAQNQGVNPTHVIFHEEFNHGESSPNSHGEEHHGDSRTIYKIKY